MKIATIKSVFRQMYPNYPKHKRPSLRQLHAVYHSLQQQERHVDRNGRLYVPGAKRVPPGYRFEKSKLVPR